MLEGQNGVTWPHWQRIARQADELGFAGLYCSDHFTNAGPPDLNALEVWTALGWLASHTNRIAFGPVVSPVSFRDPVMLARVALAIDDLSGGRLEFGLGAGWQEREHNHFGYNLLSLRERFDRFEEALEVVSQLLHSDTPVDFQGRYYRLHEAVLLPRPQRPGGPPIVIGGKGLKRTLPLVARYADQWNVTFTPPAQFRELNAHLDALLMAAGRAPSTVKRTLMTGIFYGATEERLAGILAAHGRTAIELRERGAIVGAGEAVIEQLEALQAAGVQRVMLQWMDLDDVTGIEALAATVLPRFPA